MAWIDCFIKVRIDARYGIINKLPPANASLYPQPGPGYVAMQINMMTIFIITFTLYILSLVGIHFLLSYVLMFPCYVACRPVPDLFLI